MRRARGTRIKKYHHGTLPEALIEASFELVTTEGLEALTLRQVAKAAGVTHSAPYSHFKDMAELVAALKQNAFEKLNEWLLRDLSTATEDPFQRIAVLGKSFLSFWAKYPAHFEILFRKQVTKNMDDHEFIEAGRRTFRILAVEVEKACAHPSSRKNLDVPLTAIASWSMFQGAITLWMDGPLPYIAPQGMKLEELSERLLAFWLGLIRERA